MNSLDGFERLDLFLAGHSDEKEESILYWQSQKKREWSEAAGNVLADLFLLGLACVYAMRLGLQRTLPFHLSSSIVTSRT